MQKGTIRQPYHQPDQETPADNESEERKDIPDGTAQANSEQFMGSSMKGMSAAALERGYDIVPGPQPMYPQFNIGYPMPVDID